MNSNGSRFIWMRDSRFLNTAIQSNRFFGELQGLVGADRAKSFQDFDALAKGENFDYLDPNFDVLSKYAYVRYGDVNASNYEIAQGDGNHVGTYDQAVTRIVSAFAIAQNVWPHADRELEPTPLGDDRYFGSDTYESQTLELEQQFSTYYRRGTTSPKMPISVTRLSSFFTVKGSAIQTNLRSRFSRSRPWLSPVKA